MATISEVLASFKKDIKNSFQAQKNIVDVTEKYIGLLENAEGGGSGSGGINYSETEQDTGLKWIDGKSIFQISIHLGTSPNSTGRIFEKTHNITGIDNIISYECFFNKSGDHFPVVSTKANAAVATMNLEITDTNIIINSDTAKKDYDVYCTLRYTKTN